MASNKGEVFMKIKKEDIPDNMINMLEIVGMENILKKTFIMLGFIKRKEKRWKKLSGRIKRRQYFKSYVNNYNEIRTG